jgi:hypothetical protein
MHASNKKTFSWYQGGIVGKKFEGHLNGLLKIRFQHASLWRRFKTKFISSKIWSCFLRPFKSDFWISWVRIPLWQLLQDHRTPYRFVAGLPNYFRYNICTIWGGVSDLLCLSSSLVRVGIYTNTAFFYMTSYEKISYTSYTNNAIYMSISNNVIRIYKEIICIWRIKYGYIWPYTFIYDHIWLYTKKTAKCWPNDDQSTKFASFLTSICRYFCT